MDADLDYLGLYSLRNVPQRSIMLFPLFFHRAYKSSKAGHHPKKGAFLLLILHVFICFLVFRRFIQFNHITTFLSQSRHSKKGMSSGEDAQGEKMIRSSMVYTLYLGWSVYWFKRLPCRIGDYFGYLFKVSGSEDGWRATSGVVLWICYACCWFTVSVFLRGYGPIIRAY